MFNLPMLLFRGLIKPIDFFLIELSFIGYKEMKTNLYKRRKYCKSYDCVLILTNTVRLIGYNQLRGYSMLVIVGNTLTLRLVIPRQFASLFSANLEN